MHAYRDVAVLGVWVLGFGFCALKFNSPHAKKDQMRVHGGKNHKYDRN